MASNEIINVEDQFQVEKFDVPFSFAPNTLARLQPPLKEFLRSHANTFTINSFVFHDFYEVVLNNEHMIKVCGFYNAPLDIKFVWYWQTDQQEYRLYMQPYNSDSDGWGPLDIVKDTPTLVKKCSTLTIDDLWKLHLKSINLNL